MISFRRPLAWLLFVALLFSQFATAAYACTREASMAADEFVASSAADRSSGAMADCGEMNAAAADHRLAASPLCVDHCTHATQATADTHPPVLHWLSSPPLGLFLVLAPIDRALDSPGFAQAPGMGRSIAPAIPILLGRFLS